MANQGSGLFSWLGIGFQSALGSGVAAGSMHWLPFVSESVTLNAARLSGAELRVAADEPYSHSGMQTVAGDIVLEPTPYAMAVALYAALGSISTSSVAGYNLHTITPRGTMWAAKAALPALTLRMARDVTTAVIYTDLMANTVNLEVANGDLLKVTIGVIGGKTPTQNADTQPTFVDSAQFRLPWNTCSLSIAGAGVDYIRSLVLTVNNQLGARGTLDGQLYPGRYKREGWRQVRMQAALEMEGMTDWNRLLAGTENSVVANFHVDSTNFATLTMSWGVHEAVAFNVTGPGVIDATMNLRGHPVANGPFRASVKSGVTLGIG